MNDLIIRELLILININIGLSRRVAPIREGPERSVCLSLVGVGLGGEALPKKIFQIRMGHCCILSNILFNLLIFSDLISD